MSKQLIKSLLKKYINEAYVNQQGELNDFNPEPSSDDLWSDEKFLSFVNKNLEHNSEMPEKMYSELSDNHKKLYRNELLQYGGQMIIYSENKSLIQDFIKYDYKRLEKEIMEWIELFPEMGDNGFPIDKLFISLIDEIFQGRIIQRLSDIMQWELKIPKDTFNSFKPNVKKLILKYKNDPFIIV